jgi:hypothetical protein
LVSMGADCRGMETFSTWKQSDVVEVEANLIRVSEHVGPFGSLIRGEGSPVVIGHSHELQHLQKEVSENFRLDF